MSAGHYDFYLSAEEYSASEGEEELLTCQTLITLKKARHGPARSKSANASELRSFGLLSTTVDSPSVTDPLAVASARVWNAEQVTASSALDRLPLEILLEIWTGVDEPQYLAQVSKRLHATGKDRNVRSAWLCHRFEPWLVIYEAIKRPKLLDPLLLRKLLDRGAILSRALVQEVHARSVAQEGDMFPYTIVDAPESWGLDLPLTTVIALLNEGYQLYGPQMSLRPLDQEVLYEYLSLPGARKALKPVLLRLFKHFNFMPLALNSLSVRIARKLDRHEALALKKDLPEGGWLAWLVILGDSDLLRAAQQNGFRPENCLRLGSWLCTKVLRKEAPFDYLQNIAAKLRELQDLKIVVITRSFAASIICELRLPIFQNTWRGLSASQVFERKADTYERYHALLSLACADVLLFDLAQLVHELIVQFQRIPDDVTLGPMFRQLEENFEGIDGTHQVALTTFWHAQTDEHSLSWVQAQLIDRKVSITTLQTILLRPNHYSTLPVEYAYVEYGGDETSRLLASTIPHLLRRRTAGNLVRALCDAKGGHAWQHEALKVARAAVKAYDFTSLDLGPEIWKVQPNQNKGGAGISRDERPNSVLACQKTNGKNLEAQRHKSGPPGARVTWLTEPVTCLGVNSSSDAGEYAVIFKANVPCACTLSDSKHFVSSECLDLATDPLEDLSGIDESEADENFTGIEPEDNESARRNFFDLCPANTSISPRPLRVAPHLFCKLPGISASARREAAHTLPVQLLDLHEARGARWGVEREDSRRHNPKAPTQKTVEAIANGDERFTPHEFITPGEGLRPLLSPTELAYDVVLKHTLACGGEAETAALYDKGAIPTAEHLRILQHFGRSVAGAFFSRILKGAPFRVEHSTEAASDTPPPAVEPASSDCYAVIDEMCTSRETGLIEISGIYDRLSVTRSTAQVCERVLPFAKAASEAAIRNVANLSQEHLSREIQAHTAVVAEALKAKGLPAGVRVPMESPPPESEDELMVDPVPDTDGANPHLWGLHNGKPFNMSRTDAAELLLSLDAWLKHLSFCEEVERRRTSLLILGSPDGTTTPRRAHFTGQGSKSTANPLFFRSLIAGMQNIGRWRGTLRDALANEDEEKRPLLIDLTGLWLEIRQEYSKEVSHNIVDRTERLIAGKNVSPRPRRRGQLGKKPKWFNEENETMDPTYQPSESSGSGSDSESDSESDSSNDVMEAAPPGEVASDMKIE
ncbi:hypothetical protein CBOM_01447 [Ceraceosorus bombacis]|uniref:F-box domain-containing protein n=1 Tax=Ceraceosorus bombacis TaxID=401625 RepID=A0A0N7L9E1_9BASI|nr:hypothetical protein CBOM_01447 [Ceraceosorus bombacis]